MMRSVFYSTINCLLKPFDLIIQKKEREWEREAFAKLYEMRLRRNPESSAGTVECIIFSKDRALQLHALLSSFMENTGFAGPIHVLYYTSTPRHQRSYEELMMTFPGKLNFIKQSSCTSFRNDLLAILDAVKSEKIFFLVDDVVFIEKVDLADFAKFDTDKVIPSLRMGMNLTKSYTQSKEQPLPTFTVYGDEPDKIFWRWEEGILGWSYPLSVDGHFFSTEEIKAMTRLIDFSAPNSYEDQLQRFRRFFLFREGVAYKKSVLVNIPCNKVQKENKNICGNVHQDYLLDRWENGYQMDFRKLYGFSNISVHQEIPFELIKRS